jgi:hypothetical protein
MPPEPFLTLSFSLTSFKAAYARLKAGFPPQAGNQNTDSPCGAARRVWFKSPNGKPSISQKMAEKTIDTPGKRPGEALFLKLYIFKMDNTILNDGSYFVNPKA